MDPCIQDKAKPVRRFGSWRSLHDHTKKWVNDQLAEEHAAFYEAHGKFPMKKQKAELAERVHTLLAESGVEIPYHAFGKQAIVLVDLLNHANPQFTPKEKQHDGRVQRFRDDFEEASEELRTIITDKITEHLRCFILQKHDLPDEINRDRTLKAILKAVNEKAYRNGSREVEFNDTLRDLFDELGQKIFLEIQATGVMPKILCKSKQQDLRDATVMLRTERLILRKLTKRDQGELSAMLSDPEVMSAWGRTYSGPKTVEWIVRELKRYEKDFVGYFAAVDQESRKIVGQIGLIWITMQKYRCLTVSYILSKEHWGKGYATESVKACIDYGFDLFGINNIYAVIHPDNTRAIAVAERAGMTPDGEINRPSDNKPLDKVYSIACKSRAKK